MMVDGRTDNLFTVIIPTFNRAENLDRCLNSLANQACKKFEVIVCDDGSTDETKEVVEHYREKLKLRYFYAGNWGGPARPRNTGIRNAKTEWIFFLDSDDSFSENKVAFFAGMDLENYDLLYHDLEIVKDGKVIDSIKSRQLKKDAYHDLLFNLNAIATSSVLIRTNLLLRTNGFSEDKALIAVEDFDLWIRLCETGDIRTEYIAKSLGRYYLGDDNITKVGAKQIERFNALYKPYIKKAGNVKIARRITAALNYQVGRIYALNGEIASAKIYLSKALRTGSSAIRLKAVYRLVSLLKKRR